jgi:hypothetical protein
MIEFAATINSFCQESAKNGLIGHKYFTPDNHVRDIVRHPAFLGFGGLLLPRDNNSRYYNTNLSDIARFMPYHQNVKPSVIINALNHLIDEVSEGKTIFYSFYTAEQKRLEPAKEFA